MNFESFLLYSAIKSWGYNEIQWIIANKSISEEVKERYIVNTTDILKACDIGYNWADLFNKAQEYFTKDSYQRNGWFWYE